MGTYHGTYLQISRKSLSVERIFRREERLKLSYMQISTESEYNNEKKKHSQKNSEFISSCRCFYDSNFLVYHVQQSKP